MGIVIQTGAVLQFFYTKKSLGIYSERKKHLTNEKNYFIVYFESNSCDNIEIILKQ